MPERLRRRETSGLRRGAAFVAVAVWSAIAIAVTTWELLALGSAPRSAHPTISSLVQSIEEYDAGRILFFFAWLWLGWTLAA